EEDLRAIPPDGGVGEGGEGAHRVDLPGGEGGGRVGGGQGLDVDVGRPHPRLLEPEQQQVVVDGALLHRHRHALEVLHLGDAGGDDDLVDAGGVDVGEDDRLLRPARHRRDGVVQGLAVAVDVAGGQGV